MGFLDISEGELTLNKIFIEESPASRGIYWGSAKKKSFVVNSLDIDKQEKEFKSERKLIKRKYGCIFE